MIHAKLIGTIVLLSVLVSAIIITGVLVTPKTKNDESGKTENDESAVVIALGEITGNKIAMTKGRNITTYFGIPFANPPVGELRFKASTMYDEAFENGKYAATKAGNACLQTSRGPSTKTFSEDCLNLNIYVPDNDSEPQNRSVVVYYHGGGLTSGSNTGENFEYFAAIGEVIVVVPNYRLGIFGYLSSGDSTIPGNYGLSDQILALEWIQKYISAFGGDVNDITIFGESAGSSIVGYLNLIEKSRKLIKRSIMHSKAPLKDFMQTQVAQEQFASLLTTLDTEDCSSNETEKILSCLQSASTDALQKSRSRWSVSIGLSDLISDVPYKLLLADEHCTDTLIGYNLNEGTFGMRSFSEEELITEEYQTAIEADRIYQKYMSENVTSSYEETIQTKIIAEFQPNYESDNISRMVNIDAIQNVYGDAAFICPIDEWVTKKMEFDSCSIYFYELTYRGTGTTNPEWMGVTHADDLQWFTAQPLKEPDMYTEDERVFSEKWITLWANFIKTGVPSADWTKYNNTNNKYMNIEDASFKVTDGTFPRHEICDTFWNEILRSFYK